MFRDARMSTSKALEEVSVSVLISSIPSVGEDENVLDYCLHHEAAPEAPSLYKP